MRTSMKTRVMKMMTSMILKMRVMKLQLLRKVKHFLKKVEAVLVQALARAGKKRRLKL
jgi:hypothetical protein